MPSNPSTAINSAQELSLFNRKNSIIFSDKIELALSKIQCKSKETTLAEFLEKYPTTEWWRLFVDGLQYAKCGPNLLNARYDANVEKPEFQPKKEGWLTYESKEKGSLSACLYAFNYALQHVNRPRDETDFIKIIHRYLFTDVKLPKTYPVGKFKGALYNEFALVHKYRYSQIGMQDLLFNISEKNLPKAFIEITHENQTAFFKKIAQQNKPKAEHYAAICKNFRDDKVYRYDAKTLATLKLEQPRSYEDFLTDFSDFLVNSSKPHEYCTYFPTYTTDILSIDPLYGSDWEKIGIWKFDEAELKKLRRIIPKNFSLSKESIQCLLKNMPVQFVKSLTNAIRLSLDTETEWPLNDFFLLELCRKTKELLGNKINLNVNQLIKQANKIGKDDLQTIEFSAQLNEKIQCRFSQIACASIITLIAEEYIEEKISQLVNRIWHEYYFQINHKNLACLEKIKIIGNTVQKFERIHPFVDGNGRTFVNIMLNVMLIENGLPPCTFMEPNMFDAFDQIEKVIIRGILNTLEIYQSYEQKKEVDLFGFKTTELETNENSMSTIMEKASKLVEEENKLSKKNIFNFFKKNAYQQKSLSPSNMSIRPN